jgi:Zn-dependent protease
MFQVLRVAGIPVRIDPSWLLVFALITWSLAAGYIPHALPELTAVATWLSAAAAAALLFVSVFLHELSHSLVALRLGVRVTGIRLHVFGGVSELDTEPPTPRAEFLIAVVGPLTSFVIAALCYGLGRGAAGSPWAVALTGYLAVVNLVLGLFNLVPGFPLDGGRVLRAALWSASGRLGWATQWASRIGALFAFALVALGVVRALAGEVVGGLWFVLIGAFLHQNARSGAALASARDRLERVRVADVMMPLATTVEALVVPEQDQAITPGATAWEAFAKLSRRGAARLAVLDGGRLVGVVNRRDLQHVLEEREEAGSTVGRRAA